MTTTPISEKAIFWHADDLKGLELLKASFVTHAFPRHIHEGYAVGTIERGVETFYYRGAMHVAPAGSVVIINPGEVHTGEAANEAGWTYRMFYPGLELLRRIMAELTGKQKQLPFFAAPVVRDDYLANRLRTLHHKLEGSISALERQSYFNATMADLIVRHADSRPTLPSVRMENQAIEQAKAYLEAHYADNISLDQLARLVNLSPYYLTRTFRELIGIPPHAYLTQFRITQAKSLLTAGYSIAQVAAETGFVDQSHFTRHFKRFIGVTPGQYR